MDIAIILMFLKEKFSSAKIYLVYFLVIRKNKIHKTIPFCKINNILIGKKTKNFNRFKKINESFCFSFVLENRTLDFEADSLCEKENFTCAFIEIFNFKKNNVLNLNLLFN